MRIIIIFTSLFFFSYTGFSQGDSSAVKYNLTHPLPRAILEEMQTDRPDATESAYTVAAGHFQLETDLFKQVRNRGQQLLNVENSYNLINLKFGLSQRMDLQVVIPTYVSSHTKEISTGKATENQSGMGDIVIRYKYNVWGYNGGKTALAILPFLSLPTATAGSNAVQAGIVLPFAWDIPGNWSFGTQVGLSTEKEEDHIYHSSYLYSFTFGRALGKKVDLFSEILINYSMYQQRMDIYVNGGVIFSLSDNLNVDAGFNYGLKLGSDKSFFTGLSLRL